MLRGELLDDLDAVERHRDAWDALAVAAGRPYCAPGWMLSWWREARPTDGRLSVATVVEGDELVAIAPCHLDRGPGGTRRLSFLAGRLGNRVEPLVAAGRERELAGPLVQALAQAEPDLMALDGLTTDSPWPALLSECWPGGRGAHERLEDEMPAPLIPLGEGGYEAWLDGRSSSFRRQARRMRRRLEERGASFRCVDRLDEIDRYLEAFERLHSARWGSGSAALGDGMEAMLAAAARELAPAGRLWISAIDVDGQTISAFIFVIAGREISYWNSGFDVEWSSEQPGLQTLIAAIEEAFERDATRLDLGAGAQDYKYRVAAGEESLRWLTLVPRGPRAALTRLRLTPWRLRRDATARLSPETKERLKRLLRRGPTQPGAGPP